MLIAHFFHLSSLLVLEQTVRCSWTVWFFVMFDMFEVRFWAKMWCSEVFEVWSCCYATRLGLELTVWCLRTVWFFVMFNMFEVRFWAKMWCSDIQCSECSKFGILVFVPRLVCTLWAGATDLLRGRHSIANAQVKTNLKKWHYFNE